MTGKRTDKDAIGYNSRLHRVQAVISNAKLAEPSVWNVLQHAAVAHCSQLLTGISVVELPPEAPGNVDVWHLSVGTPNRDADVAGIQAAGAQAGVHYPGPVNRSGTYAAAGGCPLPDNRGSRRTHAAASAFQHGGAEQQERLAEALPMAFRKM